MNGLDLQAPSGLMLAMLPELVVIAAAVVVLLVNAWRHQTAADSRFAGMLSLVGLVAAAAALGALWRSGAAPVGAPNMMALDGYRFGAQLLILLASIGAVLLSLDYVEIGRAHV